MNRAAIVTLILIVFAAGVPAATQTPEPGTGNRETQAHPTEPPVTAPAQPAQSPPSFPKPAPKQEDPDITFRSDVKLVNVFVTVTDQTGAPVGSLQKDDFELAEDHHPEKIALFSRESELPLSIVVAIDTSLSTKNNLKLELDSAKRFVHSIMRPVDAVSLFTFSELVDQLVPFTPDVQRIDRAIERIRPGSATAVYDAVYLAGEALEDRKGRKVMIMITDGGDTMSKTSFQEAVREAQQSEAIVYPIIIVPIESNAGRDIGGEHALIEIARETGGKYYYATDLPTLDKAFRQISDELRTQYLLAFYPSRRLADSSFRRIEVKVKDHPDLRARHRAGYYTSKNR
jgi:Ca-activated chloride channel homolog